MPCDVSIIIPFIKQLEDLTETVHSIQKSKTKLSFEIVVIQYVNNQESVELSKQFDSYDNISILKSNLRSASVMLNLGAANAVGKYIYFTDTNNIYNDYWMDSLVEVLEAKSGDAAMPAIKDSMSDKFGYGGTWNENLNFVWLKEPEANDVEIPFAPSYAFLMKADVFKAIGGFNEYLQSKGIEDHEFSLRLWLFGYKILINKNVIINRNMKHINYFEPELYDIVHNYMVLAYSHFNLNRFSKVIELLSSKSCFNNVAAHLFDNENLLNLRDTSFINRKYDDDYFFNKFNIPF